MVPDIVGILDGTCNDILLSEVVEGFGAMTSMVWVISSIGIWPGRTVLIGFGIEVSATCFEDDVIGTCEDVPLTVVVEGFGAMTSVVWVISSVGIWPGRTAIIGFRVEVLATCEEEVTGIWIGF